MPENFSQLDRNLAEAVREVRELKLDLDAALAGLAKIENALKEMRRDG
jgi:hypothetical protein